MQPERGRRCPSQRGGGGRNPLPSSVLLSAQEQEETINSCCNQGIVRLPGTFALIKTSWTGPEGNFLGSRAEFSLLDAELAGKGVGMEGRCEGH